MPMLDQLCLLFGAIGQTMLRALVLSWAMGGPVYPTCSKREEQSKRIAFTILHTTTWFLRYSCSYAAFWQVFSCFLVWGCGNGSVLRYGEVSVCACMHMCLHGGTE